MLGLCMNLNQVTLAACCMEKTKAFYSTLGFTLIVDTHHYIRFACPEGESTFSFVIDEAINNPSTIYFEHEQLDTWVESLVAKGIAFEYLPTNKPYLWREASLVDPSGNLVKLYWAGKYQLDPPWKVFIQNTLQELIVLIMNRVGRQI